MSSWAERYGKLTVAQALELNEAVKRLEKGEKNEKRI